MEALRCVRLAVVGSGARFEPIVNAGPRGQGPSRTRRCARCSEHGARSEDDNATTKQATTRRYPVEKHEAAATSVITWFSLSVGWGYSPIPNKCKRIQMQLNELDLQLQQCAVGRRTYLYS